MRKFRSVLMRGGTARGLFFLKDDLPPDHKDWESIILQGIGGPDPKQLIRLVQLQASFIQLITL